VRAIVTAHGGIVTATSLGPDRGTTITLTLPFGPGTPQSGGAILTG
jgi:signal transduction histidine kinase